jgi:hypothetical protein
MIYNTKLSSSQIGNTYDILTMNKQMVCISLCILLLCTSCVYASHGTHNTFAYAEYNTTTSYYTSPEQMIVVDYLTHTTSLQEVPVEFAYNETCINFTNGPWRNCNIAIVYSKGISNFAACLLDMISEIERVLDQIPLHNMISENNGNTQQYHITNQAVVADHKQR